MINTLKYYTTGIKYQFKGINYNIIKVYVHIFKYFYNNNLYINNIIYNYAISWTS